MGIAAALLATAAPAPRADVWRVTPIPNVRALCHAADSLWVGTSAGIFILDIRTGALVRHVEAGARLPGSSVRAIAARGDSVLVGTDQGLALFASTGGRDATRVWTSRAPGDLKGLPLAGVCDISFAGNGDWLLGTRAGVGIVGARRRYTITRADSLPSNDVVGSLERADGARWFATRAGLFSWVDDTTHVTFHAGAGIPRGEIRDFTGDARVAYLLINGRGVYRFDGKRAVRVEGSRDVPLPSARSISLGADGALWAVGHGWIAVARGKKWERVRTTAGDADTDWRVVVADGAGAFAGSARGVVTSVGRGGEFRVQLPGVLPAAGAASIRGDGRGGAWLVSGGRPVHVDAAARSVRVEESPSDVRAIAVDADGNLHAAGRTVLRLVNGAWTDLAPDVDEADPVFTALASGAGNELWVGTASGDVFRYDGAIWLRFDSTAIPSRPRGAVVDLVTAAGEVWSRRAGGGVRNALARPGTRSVADSTAALTVLACTPSGEIVAAGGRELFRFETATSRWRRVSAADLLGSTRPVKLDPPGAITALAFDGNGRFFVGTTEALGTVNRDRAAWNGPESRLGGGAIADLCIQSGCLWIAFAREGLSVVTLARTP